MNVKSRNDYPGPVQQEAPGTVHEFRVPESAGFGNFSILEKNFLKIQSTFRCNET